jgi:exopolysaccharide biosynthesis polyprenyl glycosylphosphotransferase
MASKVHNGWNWMPFSNGSGAGIAPAPAFEPDAFSAPEVTGVPWPEPCPQNGQDRQTAHRARYLSGLTVQVAYALIDILCVCANGVVAYFFRYAPAVPRGDFFSGYSRFAVDQPLLHYAAFLFLYVALILLFCQWQDLYTTPRTRSSQAESMAVLKAVSLATLLLASFIYLSGVKIVSRIVVVTSLVLNVMALATWRYAKRRIVIRRVERGIGARNAVIVGAGRVGQALARQLEQHKLLGYCFKGFLDGNHSGDPRLLGKIEDLSKIVRAEFIDVVFITIPSERALVKSIALQGREHHLAVKVIPDLYDGLAWNVPLRRIGDFPVMEVCWRPIPTLGLFLKRVFDILFSSLALIFLSPFLAALALWIKLDSPGPVLYCSKRVGKKGRVFTCCKFRTMVPDADDLKDSLRHLNEREGPFFKISDDPRVTRLGKFLRKYSLDELPQFLNVLKGDMSLVGPRPHPLDDYSQYDLDHLRRLEVKPGITGLWQVTARQDPSFDTNMRLDLEYIDRWNFSLDLKILLMTVPAVFTGMGQ